ncbi:MAG: Rv3235 family protein [Nitriliruptoraceae bacterium]
MSERSHMLYRETPPRPPNSDPKRLVVVLVLAYFDVCAGRRPYTQIAPLFSPAARMHLTKTLARKQRHDTWQPTTIQRVVMQAPHPHAREACILVERAGRITAVTVRIERHQGMWRVAELASPEAPTRPLRTASCPGQVRDAFDAAADDADTLTRRDSA